MGIWGQRQGLRARARLTWVQPQNGARLQDPYLDGVQEMPGPPQEEGVGP